MIRPPRQKSLMNCWPFLFVGCALLACGVALYRGGTASLSPSDSSWKEQQLLLNHLQQRLQQQGNTTTTTTTRGHQNATLDESMMKSFLFSIDNKSSSRDAETATNLSSIATTTNGSTTTTAAVKTTPVDARTETTNEDNKLVNSICHPNHSSLPSWMREYFAWHVRERAQLTRQNWKTRHKYMLVRCLNRDKRCGGASDRLQTIPILLLMAHETKRLLFIEWERPAALTEFLVPPEHGLDWTIPTSLRMHGGDVYSDIWNVRNHYLPFLVNGTLRLENKPRPDKLILTVRFQSAEYGSDYFNTYHRDQKIIPSDYDLFRRIYRLVWSCVFTPSPQVQKALEVARTELGLDDGKPYSAVHIRSKYHDDLAAEEYTWTRPVSCMAHHRPNLPMLVAADDPTVALKAVTFAQSTFDNLQAMTRPPQTTLHLDRGSSYLEKRPRRNPNRTQHAAPSAYYNVFVDLYLLADASCIAYHYGGFGRWAWALSTHECVVDYGKLHCDSTGLFRGVRRGRRRGMMMMYNGAKSN